MYAHLVIQILWEKSVSLYILKSSVYYHFFEGCDLSFSNRRYFSNDIFLLRTRSLRQKERQTSGTNRELIIPIFTTLSRVYLWYGTTMDTSRTYKFQLSLLGIMMCTRVCDSLKISYYCNETATRFFLRNASYLQWPETFFVPNYLQKRILYRTSTYFSDRIV